MNRRDRPVFSACVVMAMFAIGWVYVWYRATSAVFSDMSQHGIVYGSEAYSAIVAITQRHIIGIVSPVVAVLFACLGAWCFCLFRTVKNPPDESQGLVRGDGLPVE